MTVVWVRHSEQYTEMPSDAIITNLNINDDGRIRS